MLFYRSRRVVLIGPWPPAIPTKPGAYQLVVGCPLARSIIGVAPPEEFADPLPQALALTAIVITFALTTFLLALGYRSYVLVGHDEVQDDVEDRRIARKTPSAPLEDDETDDEDGEQERADDEVESAATGEPR